MATDTSQPALRVQQPKLSFRADIQGLRAIAVLLVVIYHSGVSTLSGGYVGVDVFFVISGFLITSHLLESLARDGQIRLGQFYAKRARRILPASLTVLILTVIAALIWIPPLQLEMVIGGAIATALYVPNVLFAIEGTNYLAETTPSVFQHYWSLGIEEQFYLIWPLALIAIFRITKSERSAFWVAAGLVVASFTACILLTPISQSWTFFSLPTRAWELGVGALMAFAMRSQGQRVSRSRSGILAWVGLLALLTIAVTYNADTPFPSYFAAGPVIATAMIIWGGVGRLSPTRLLSATPLQFLGLISYSLYLVHWPILVIPQAASGLNDTWPLWATVILGVLSFPAAYLLYYLVEDPMRKYRPLATSRPLNTLFVVAILTALIAGGTGAVGKFAERQPLHAGMFASNTSPELLPSGTRFVPSNLNPGLRTSASDNALIYSNGCHRDNDSTNASGCQFGGNENAPLVALFGDSHAASWFPALHELAKEGIIRLDVNTKSSCASVSVPTVLYGRPYHSCEEWRKKVTQRLTAEKPDLILLANRGALPFENGSIKSINHWQDAVARTVNQLTRVSEVAVIADVPNMGVTPAICLSANLERAEACSRPRDQAFAVDIASAEKAATSSNGATYLDFNDYLCNATNCPAIVGDELVYRDEHHLTATFSAALQEPVGREVYGLIK